MKTRTTRPSRAEADHLASQAAGILVLLMPVALLHARAAADILIGLIDGCFLIHCWACRQWAWRRQPFLLAAAFWWAWLVLCSALGTGGLLLSLVTFRLPLFAVALGTWALRPPGRRLVLRWLLTAASGWIALQAWQQYLTGTNMFSQVRWVDGALTGPFNKPRAGPALILVFFPVLIPAVMGLLSRSSLVPRLAAGCIALLSVATMILIGQRMPTMLMVVGLVLTALLLPRLRVAVAGIILAGCLLLAATPMVSPATYGKLVLQFADQMQHFPASAYGQIYARAIAMTLQHPWFGQGFDAFRRGCPAAAGEACNIHPHNYYLEAAVDGGLPLLLAFCLMGATALWRIGIAPAHRNDWLRVGLFVGAAIAFWPAASTSAFTSLPNAGWIFLCLGLGFAITTHADHGTVPPG